MMDKTHWHTIIVGSGFAGASVAATLCTDNSVNTDVLMLERGPWRDTRPVRMAGIDQRAPFPAGKGMLSRLLHRLSLPLLGDIRLHRHGLFDIHPGKDMTVICSSQVGGGSHVYSGMNVRPASDSYWDRPTLGLSSAEMEAHYCWIIGTMGAKNPASVTDSPYATWNRFGDHPDLMATATDQPDMSVIPAEDGRGNNSFFGCPDGSKATVDVRLLVPAIEAGLTLQAEKEVISIATQSDNTYRLEVRDLNRRTTQWLTCSRLILSAGTLNTLRLLMRSRELGGLTGMPALGLGFGGNGDMPAWWATNTPHTDYTRDLPCHGRLHLRGKDNLPQTMDGHGRVDLTCYGLNGTDFLPVPEKIKQRLRRDQILVGMGADRADGVVRWSRGRLSIRYLHENNPVLASVAAHFREIAKRSGFPVWFSEKTPLTVHPLGGARMATSANEGVVNGRGEVYGHPGLYVADAAALPAAPGTPPSMTIAAWARHLALNLSNNT